MEIQIALIAWNAPCDDLGPDDPSRLLPRVIVVRKTDPFPSGWSRGYRSTNGACCSDWRTDDEMQATLNILVMFRRLALQGIPPQEIHRAFFEIEEYRRACGWDMSLNGDEFNP